VASSTLEKMQFVTTKPLRVQRYREK